MTADLLRRTASAVRAEWQNDDHTSDGRCKFPTTCAVDNAHPKIADPAVALALADWLDTFRECVADDKKLAKKYVAEMDAAVHFCRIYLDEPTP